MCGYITWKSIQVAEYIYHCVTISPGKLSKLRSIYIIVCLYHLENYQSCGVYISLCGYIMWKSIKVAEYIYHCVAVSRCKTIKVAEYIYYFEAISREKVLNLRNIYTIVWLYNVETY